MHHKNLSNSHHTRTEVQDEGPQKQMKINKLIILSAWEWLALLVLSVKPRCWQLRGLAALWWRRRRPLLVGYRHGDAVGLLPAIVVYWRWHRLTPWCIGDLLHRRTASNQIDILVKIVSRAIVFLYPITHIRLAIIGNWRRRIPEA